VSCQDTFKEKLKYLLKDNNMSQLELSKILNCSRQTVSTYMVGGTVPNIVALNDIANYFNVSTDYLLGRTENKQTKIDKFNLESSVNIVLSEVTSSINKMIKGLHSDII